MEINGLLKKKKAESSNNSWRKKNIWAQVLLNCCNWNFLSTATLKHRRHIKCIYIYIIYYILLYSYILEISPLKLLGFFIGYISKLLFLKLCWYLHLRLTCFLCSCLTYLEFQFILNFEDSMRHLSIVYFFLFLFVVYFCIFCSSQVSLSAVPLWFLTTFLNPYFFCYSSLYFSKVPFCCFPVSLPLMTILNSLECVVSILLLEQVNGKTKTLLLKRQLLNLKWEEKLNNKYSLIWTLNLFLPLVFFCIYYCHIFFINLPSRLLFHFFTKLQSPISSNLWHISFPPVLNQLPCLLLCWKIKATQKLLSHSLSTHLHFCLCLPSNVWHFCSSIQIQSLHMFTRFQDLFSTQGSCSRKPSMSPLHGQFPPHTSVQFCYSFIFKNWFSFTYHSLPFLLFSVPIRAKFSR